MKILFDLGVNFLLVIIFTFLFTDFFTGKVSNYPVKYYNVHFINNDSGGRSGSVSIFKDIKTGSRVVVTNNLYLSDVSDLHGSDNVRIGVLCPPTFIKSRCELAYVSEGGKTIISLSETVETLSDIKNESDFIYILCFFIYLLAYLYGKRIL
ncbi:hypothetical protein D5018_11795 [Parashewanella curva]|uniref:Uncharacterized protein n=1 Tax=Parashewanella curva TaxID=2338552 RepID=A0A3L8PZF5_9GAMM|nr:hypothetical protein [Parashewanella curva]RLV59462.1 hypothetical protein D5018_11795 [Parashewanella curva]